MCHAFQFNIAGAAEAKTPSSANDMRKNELGRANTFQNRRELTPSSSQDHFGRREKRRNWIWSQAQRPFYADLGRAKVIGGKSGIWRFRGVSWGSSGGMGPARAGDDPLPQEQKAESCGRVGLVRLGLYRSICHPSIHIHTERVIDR